MWVLRSQCKNHCLDLSPKKQTLSLFTPPVLSPSPPLHLSSSEKTFTFSPDFLFLRLLLVYNDDFLLKTVFDVAQ